MRFLLTLLSALILTNAATASDSHYSHQSDYVGQQDREIKSLSPEDISELRQGGGWGFAKAAELNGVPGPLHLLEMKAEIPLDDGQIEKIERLYDAMKAEAIVRGERLIALEQKLETHFQSRSITEETLRRILTEIAVERSNLRFTHLSAHLRTPDVLTETQINRYNELRGYNNDDPCDAVPDGHDASMWRKHNGCE